MLLAHAEVFDEIITGVSNTWYSSAEFNEMIGSGDFLRVFAVATDLTGSGTLNVYVDRSSDNEHWDAPDTPTISEPLAANFVEAGALLYTLEPLASFARLRVDITDGSSPQCRLKLSVTARSA